MDKDLERNRLIVTQGEGRELYSRALETSKFHFIAGEPPSDTFRCMAKFRYRQTIRPLPLQSGKKAH